MEAQRERARAGATFDAADGTESGALYQRIGAEIPPIEFVGYESLTSPAKILDARPRHPARAARPPRARRSR